MKPGYERRKLWSWSAVAICFALSLYLLVFPLQDFDTFWHLAYGRAMLESGTFINHEMYSYTASGKFLASHSQLAQFLLYVVWAIGGANALLGFKLLVASVVFALIVATARLFRFSASAGAVLALAVFAVGIGRFVERPELFSVLLQPLLIWLLFRARRHGYPHRGLWPLPLLLVLWDYLHGALYGLVILLVFAGAETARGKILPRFARQREESERVPGLKRLMIWSGGTLVAMFLHPNGLLAYDSFWRVGSSPEFRMYGEFMAPTRLQFLPYWIFLAVALLLIVFGRRYCDLTTVSVMLPFLGLSLMYNRAVLAFCLAAVPAVSQAVEAFRERMAGFSRNSLLPLFGWLLFIASVLAYKQFFVIEAFRFGTGVSDKVFPVGSARFVSERGLTGNMYNMNAYGGYLAFFLGPERKIFHYNQPGVFTALFDYLHKPASRREWPIDYAIIGDSLEFNMFDREGYVTVYQEPTAAVMVRNDDRNKALIQRYRVSFFGPLMSDDELLALAQSPLKEPRLLQEMSDYLTFRQDGRISSLFAGLLRKSSAVASDALRMTLLEPALRYNRDSVALQGLKGEVLCRQGDSAGAELAFGEALALSPEDYPARLGLGYLDYDRGRFESAVKHFDVLTEAYPRQADAYYAQGLANMKLCRKEQSRRAFGEFLSLAPQSRYVPKAREFLRALEQGCP